MAERAIVSPRAGTPRAARAARAAMSEATELRGVTQELELPSGAVVVTAEAEQLSELEARGFRVTPLPEPDTLRIGMFRINTTTRVEEIEEQRDAARGPVAAMPAAVDALRQAPEEEGDWRHHLIHLKAPPTAEWVREIETHGVDVVEPVSRYGVFAVGTREAMTALLAALPYVEAVLPFKPAYRLAPGLPGSGVVRYLKVSVYPASEQTAVRSALERLAAEVVDQWEQPATYGGIYQVLIVEADAAVVPQMAAHPAVRSIEYEAAGLTADDERTCQIVAGQTDGVFPPDTAPLRGYRDTLSHVGLDGTGVVIGICDTGVDSHDPSTMHSDLRGRFAFFEDVTGGRTTRDVNGHGTHVAGISAGDPNSGPVDHDGFLLGQGVAPGSLVGSVNAVDTVGSPGTGPLEKYTQIMVRHGAHVMNNSWRHRGSPGYTTGAQLVDRLVRDPNNDDLADPSRSYLILVFSAGNAGPNLSTISPPKEAKNPIVVGNCLNFRPGELAPIDDIRGIADTSSRGPARDGRILPTIVAPGNDVVSARSTVDVSPSMPGVQRPRFAYEDRAGTVHPDHVPLSGTSMAAPHVAGLCALLIQWWRNRHGGVNPSAAMLKALLVNGAEDLQGGDDGRGNALDHIPNNDQGWGRVNLGNIVLDSPASSRGPKVLFDQHQPLTQNGEELVVRVAPADTSRVMRVTLAWTDAPGSPSTSPSLVNDLNLELVETTATGAQRVFKGNVFARGFSISGGTFDTVNNVECVYVQEPQNAYEVRVIAASLRGDARPPFSGTARWQDFALVIDNARVES